MDISNTAKPGYIFMKVVLSQLSQVTIKIISSQKKIDFLELVKLPKPCMAAILLIFLILRFVASSTSSKTKFLILITCLIKNSISLIK